MKCCRQGLSLFGDFVAYGHGRGEIQIGKVISVVATPVTSNWGTQTRHTIKLRAARKQGYGHNAVLVIADRNSTLSYPNRMVVMPTIPLHIAALFKDAGF